MGAPERPPDQLDELTHYFSKSVAAVRESSERFERDYANPAVKSSAAAFSAYPISTTFVAIFTVLSFLPILTFLAVIIFTVASALTIAVCVAFAFSTVIFLISGGVLLSVLALTVLFSSILTVFALGSYLFARLLILVRSSGRNGISDWATETKQTFWRARDPKVEGHDDPYSSEDSGVVIKHEERDGYVVDSDKVGIPMPSDSGTGNVMDRL